MTDNKVDVINKLEESIFNGYIDNNVMVQIIELLKGYLNLQTLSNYAKSENISYNAAKKRKKETLIINGITFVINNL